MSGDDTDELPAAGWYRDPTADGQQRYWDGQSWTRASAALQDGPEAPPPTPSSAQSGANTGFDTGLLFVVGMLVLVGGCGVMLTRFSSTIDDGGRNQFDVPATVVMDGPFLTTTTTGPPVTFDATVTLPPTTTTSAADGNTSTTALGAEIVINYGSFTTTPAEMATGVGADRAFTVWDVLVDGPIDITEGLVAANPSVAPPEGSQIVAIPMVFTLLHSDAGVVPFLVLLDSLHVVYEGGATGGGYTTAFSNGNDPLQCSLVIDTAPDIGEIVVGDTFQFSICIPVPIADLDHGDSRVTVEVGNGQRMVWNP